MKAYISNPKDIDGYLRSYGRVSGIFLPDLSRLLIFTLRGPLQHDVNGLKEIKRPDGRWGEKLLHQFNTRGAQKWFRFEPTDTLDQVVIRIRDWLAWQLYHKADWIYDCDTGGKPKSLTTIQTVEDALNMVETSEALSVEELRKLHGRWPGEEETAKGNIETVMKFDDGFRIVQILNKEAMEREGCIMRFCVNNPEKRADYFDVLDKGREDCNDVFYSLRDRNNMPHITLHTDVYETMPGIVWQCRGKCDEPPRHRYYSYIQQFIQNRGFDLSVDAGDTGLIKQDGVYLSIFDLPESFTVKGHYIVRKLERCPSIPSRIEGTCLLTGTPATNEDIANLSFIGGDLDIRDTDITDLSCITKVGGKVWCDLSKGPVSLEEAKKLYFDAHNDSSQVIPTI